MTIFTYSFPSAAPNPNTFEPSAGTTTIPGFAQYSGNSGLTQAFNMWSNVANLQFNPGTTGNHLSIAYWNIPVLPFGRGSGSTFTTDTNFNTATNFWILLNRYFNVNDPTTANGGGPADFMINNPTINNWGVWNIAHEIGHTLLGDNHASLVPNPPSPVPTNDFRLSIMFYPNNHSVDGIPLPNGDVPIPLTPGMTDIYLVQKGGATPEGTNISTYYNTVYYNNTKTVITHGVSTAQDGNTSYIFTDNSVTLGGLNSTSVVGSPSKYVMTLWDRPVAVGGIDTIDASAMTTKNYINLSAGEFSSIGSNINTAPPTTSANLGGNATPDGDTKWNVGIALGAQIENAYGGAGNDLILGNALVNILLGNGGEDQIYGGAGGDLIMGGDGADSILHGGTDSNWMTGGAGKDRFYLDVHRNVNANNTWSTITDFKKLDGETATLWGWQVGVSRFISHTTLPTGTSPLDVTYHFDLDGNNIIDTSIAFTGLTSANVPNYTTGIVSGVGYILFG